MIEILNINILYKKLNDDLVKGLSHHGFDLAYVKTLCIRNPENSFAKNVFEIVFVRKGYLFGQSNSCSIIYGDNYPPVNEFLLYTLLNYKSYIRDSKLDQIGIVI